MRKVFGYVRVSTVDQEQGFGPAAQEERIRNYAREHGLEPVEFFQESKSGESLAPRHELNIMLARADAVIDENGDAHIIFAGLDRLSRNLIDQESVVLRSHQKGVRLHSTLLSENDTLDPEYAGDPMRTAIRQFFGIINQLDRAIIQRRLDGGLAKKASQGGFTGGRIPFGYRSNGGELEIHPEQAPVIRKLFALTETLNQRVVAAILSKTYPAQCSRLTHQTVSRILKHRELYEGQFKPRGSSETFHRPDLAILGTGVVDSERIKASWEDLPDPVPVDALALLWEVPAQKILHIAGQNGIVVRHVRRRDYLSKAKAEALSKYVKSGD